METLLSLSNWTLTELLGLVPILGQLVGALHIPSVLLRRTHRPMAQLTWILCLLTLPFLGVLLWWGFGRTHLVRKRRERAVAVAAVNEGLRALDVRSTQSELATRPAVLVDDNEVFPTTADNRVKLLIGGDDAYDAFEAAIRDAKHSVHLAFYIWNRDGIGTRLRDLLAKKAAQGVEVRLLYDAWGASAVSFGGFMDPIRKAGGKVAPFLPFRVERQLRVNFRNHRKIIICDGKVGFTGGLNIGDEYRQWYDLAVRVHGPVVNQLQEVFAEDWYFATDENLAAPEYFHAEPVTTDEEGYEDVVARVIASGPDSRRSITHVMFFLAITMSRERIWITTPYFTPDPAILTALRTASMRGVDVRLLLPGKSDVRIAQAAGRGYFDELLDAGVKIWEYQPQVLHAKVLLVDDSTAIIGSSNMDTRSFHLQFEVNLAIDNPSVNEELAAEFRSRMEDATQIEAEVWAKRSTLLRLRDAAARLMSPVL